MPHCPYKNNQVIADVCKETKKTGILWKGEMDGVQP